MNLQKPCVGVFVFGSKGSGFLSGSITTVTRPNGWNRKDVPTHAGVLFVYDDASVDYAEAFLGEDWATGLDIAKLKAYARAGDGQWVRCYRVPLTLEQCQRVRAMAQAYTRLWHYSIAQLLRMLRHRLTFGLWPVPMTPTLVCCSEAVARLLRPCWPEIMKESRRETLEDVAPVDLFVAAQACGIKVKSLAQMLDEVGVA